MIHVDEDALICDLAETYQIYDYKSLPAHLVATFSCGLEDDSRIKRKLSGLTVPINIMMMASITDSVNTLVWFNSEDGHKNRNRPKSILESLLYPDKTEPDEIETFETPEEFETYKREILRKGGFINGN